MIALPRVPLDRALRLRKEFITIDDTAQYKRCRVQLHAQGVVLRDVVEGAQIKTKSQQLCRSGDFLVAEIDAKVGGFGIVPEGLEGAIVSSHYFLFEINEQVLDRRYLGWVIRTAEFRDQVAARGTTNYAAIRPGHVLAYTIPLPPLAEQRRIVDRVKGIAARADEARRLRAVVESDLNRVAGSLNDALAGDRIVQLEEVLMLDEDRVDVVSSSSYPQVGLRGFGGGLFPKPAIAGSDTTYLSFNRLYAGAVVLSQVKGWEGAVAVAGREFAGMFASPEYRTFRCRGGQLDSSYFGALVRTPWFYSKLATLTRGVGARRERIRPEAFLALRIPLPPIEKQSAALGALSRIADGTSEIPHVLAALGALLPSVLDGVFRGRTETVTPTAPADPVEAEQGAKACPA